MTRTKQLQEALSWTLSSFKAALAGAPVRNADEVISFAQAALERSCPECGGRGYNWTPMGEGHEPTKYPCLHCALGLEDGKSND